MTFQNSGWLIKEVLDKTLGGGAGPAQTTPGRRGTGLEGPQASVRFRNNTKNDTASLDCVYLAGPYINNVVINDSLKSKASKVSKSKSK